MVDLKGFIVLSRLAGWKYGFGRQFRITRAALSDLLKA